MTILAYTDGASRGNPGDSGVGIILRNEEGDTITAIGKFIGKATNNIAEYTALITCLSMVRDTACSHLIVHSDSELMVRQLRGQYRVKDADLKVLFEKVQDYLQSAPFSFEIKYISREQNHDADVLANRSLNLRQTISL